MNLAQQDIERFWSNVHIGRADECWPWQASQTSTGYGQFRIGSRTRGDRTVVRSHIVAFTIAHGYEPATVRHTCGHEDCCNPAHISDGTENAQPFAARIGRPPTKVPNPELVFQLKRQGLRQVDIAAQLGLTQQYVSHILSMKRRVPGVSMRGNATAV
jgi:hypothetical protein